MYPCERQQYIIERIHESGSVKVAELSAKLAVTRETIRRDLSILAGGGHLRRVYGGAVAAGPRPSRPGWVAERSRRAEEKEQIARAALAEVPDGAGAIALDVGTTIAELARILPVDRQLTVLTNALPVTLSLATRSNIEVLLVGGQVSGRPPRCVGRWAIDGFVRSSVDVAFVSPTGISVRGGLTTRHQSGAAVKRAMIAAARRTVVLADHTKFRVENQCRFADWEDIDTIITDSGADERTAAAIGVQGPRVVFA